MPVQEPGSDLIVKCGHVTAKAFSLVSSPKLFSHAY